MTIAAGSGEQTLEPSQQMTESANQIEGELAQLRAASFSFQDKHDENSVSEEKEIGV